MHSYAKMATLLIFSMLQHSNRNSDPLPNMSPVFGRRCGKEMHQPMMQSVQIRIILMVTLLAWIRSNYRDTGSEPRYHFKCNPREPRVYLLMEEFRIFGNWSAWCPRRCIYPTRPVERSSL